MRTQNPGMPSSSFGVATPFKVYTTSREELSTKLDCIELAKVKADPSNFPREMETPLDSFQKLLAEKILRSASKKFPTITGSQSVIELLVLSSFTITEITGTDSHELIFSLMLAGPCMQRFAKSSSLSSAFPRKSAFVIPGTPFDFGPMV